MCKIWFTYTIYEHVQIFKSFYKLTEKSVNLYNRFTKHHSKSSMCSKGLKNFITIANATPKISWIYLNFLFNSKTKNLLIHVTIRLYTINIGNKCVYSWRSRFYRLQTSWDFWGIMHFSHRKKQKQGQQPVQVNFQRSVPLRFTMNMTVKSANISVIWSLGQFKGFHIFLDHLWFCWRSQQVVNIFQTCQFA